VTSLLLAALLSAAPVAAAGSLPPVRDGDVVFQTSRSAQSLAIQRATRSPWSHMGIVFLRGGAPYVIEAVEPVKATPLARWVARGEGGRVAVKRLRDADRVLTPATVAGLRREAERFLGRHYDLAFGWSDDRVYCSELVWKAYQRALGRKLGALERMASLRDRPGTPRVVLMHLDLKRVTRAANAEGGSERPVVRSGGAGQGRLGRPAAHRGRGPGQGPRDARHRSRAAGPGGVRLERGGRRLGGHQRRAGTGPPPPRAGSQPGGDPASRGAAPRARAVSALLTPTRTRR
jgi:hypothetical protein